jgi:polysaccharide export outer membrane protein
LNRIKAEPGRHLVPRLATLLCLLPIVSGCSEPPRSQDLTLGETQPVYLDTLSPAEQAAAAEAISNGLQRGTSSYHLQPGDRIEVMYEVSGRRLRPYRIGIRDELDIDFQFDRELNRQVVVRPDGMISLPGRGEISAFELRPMDLAARIADRYRDIAVDPVVTVSVRRFNSPTDELVEVVQNGAEGRARPAVVRPDGLVDLPMASGIRAAGRTPEELKEALDARYASTVGSVRTTVRVTAIAANQIFVFGEVKQPGAVPAPGPRTILQTVAAAGGPLPTGALDQVRVLYFDPLGRAHLRVVNLERVLTDLRLSEDMVVPPNSTVYVPPTQLAKAGRYVDQIVKQIFLYNGINIGITPWIAQVR